MLAKDVILTRLKQARVRPVDLASAIKVSKQQASMMLSGQRGISTKHLDGVAKLLNVSVAELFAESDPIGHSNGVDSASVASGSIDRQEAPRNARVASAPSLDPALIAPAIREALALVLMQIVTALGPSDESADESAPGARTG